MQHAVASADALLRVIWLSAINAIWSRLPMGFAPQLRADTFWEGISDPVPLPVVPAGVCADSCSMFSSRNLVLGALYWCCMPASATSAAHIASWGLDHSTATPCIQLTEGGCILQLASVHIQKCVSAAVSKLQQHMLHHRPLSAISRWLYRCCA